MEDNILPSMLDTLSGLQRLRHNEEKHQTKQEIERSLASLDISHTQEMHASTLDAEKQKAQLDLDQQKQSAELKLVEAAAKGIVAPSMLQQDPVIQPQGPEKHPVQTLDDYLKAVRAKKEAQGQTITGSNEATEYISSEILKNLKKLDTEKSLDYSNGFSRLFGGIMDAAIPFAGLGTSVFGSEMSAADKLEILNRSMYSLSPLVRTEVNEALGDRKLDLAEKKRQAGLSGIGSIKTDTEFKSASDALFDIETKLTSNADLAPVWGSNANSSNNLGAAFNAWRNLKVQAKQFSTLTDEEDIKSAYSALEQNQEALSNMLKELHSSGMTTEQFANYIKKAQSVVTESDYMKPLDLNPMSGSVSNTVASIHMSRFEAVSSFAKDMGQFYNQAGSLFAVLDSKKAEQDKEKLSLRKLQNKDAVRIDAERMSRAKGF